MWAEDDLRELYDDIEADTRIADALEKVIDDAAIATVGGLLVRAEGTPAHGFHYLPRSKMVSGHRLPEEPEVTEGVIQRVTAAEGAFGYRICPGPAGIGALGVYFIQGLVGAFLYPTRQSAAYIYRGVTQAQFAAAVKGRLRLRTNVDTMLQPSTPPATHNG